MNVIPEPVHTAISNDPQNNNFLNPLNFKFILKRAPNLNFFLQKITFPGISVAPVRQATPFVDIWRPGVDAEFRPLNISFRVDENLQNYMEIQKWLLALGEEETLHPYEHLTQASEFSGQGVVSEIILTILDSSRIPNYVVTFHDSFPISLSSMEFDVTPQSIPYQVASSTFRYTNYDIEKVV